jgi:hypothetical protein
VTISADGTASTNEKLRSLNLSVLKQELAIANPEFSRSVFLIAVPNTVHFIVPSVRLVGEHDVLIIDNGLQSWEREELDSRLSSVPRIQLITGERTVYPHGYCVDLIVEAACPTLKRDHILDKIVSGLHGCRPAGGRARHNGRRCGSDCHGFHPPRCGPHRW